MLNKINFFIVALSLLLCGCTKHTNTQNNNYHEDEKKIMHLAILGEYKEIAQKQIKNNTYNINNNVQLDYFDVSFPLSWYYGPILNIDKNKYELLAKRELGQLIKGFGVGDEIDLKYRHSKYNDPSAFKKLGIKSIKELYLHLYYKLVICSLNESYEYLKALEKQGLIDLDYLLNDQVLIAKTKQIIEKKYKDYKKYEKTSLPTVDLLSKWFFLIEEDKTYFTFESYYIFSLIELILENTIENSDKIRNYEIL